jgi:hypothetical protein
MKKYGAVKILMAHMHIAADTQEPTAFRTHNNTQHTTKKNINTVTMVPPSRWLPAAPILQVSAIAIRCTINHNHCNTAMYFLLTTLTFPLFILLLFYVQRLSALTD